MQYERSITRICSQNCRSCYRCSSRRRWRSTTLSTDPFAAPLLLQRERRCDRSAEQTVRKYLFGCSAGAAAHSTPHNPINCPLARCFISFAALHPRKLVTFRKETDKEPSKASNCAAAELAGLAGVAEMVAGVSPPQIPPPLTAVLDAESACKPDPREARHVPAAPSQDLHSLCHCGGRV